MKGEHRVKIEQKDEEEEERRQTSRKRKSSQPYTPLVDTVKVTSKGRRYIQPGERPTDRSPVPYDPAHRVPNDIMNEFMSWLTSEDIGPHKSGTGILFRRNCTTEQLFEELTQDNEWVKNDVSYLTFNLVYDI